MPEQYHRRVGKFFAYNAVHRVQIVNEEPTIAVVPAEKAEVAVACGGRAVSEVAVARKGNALRRKI